MTHNIGEMERFFAELDGLLEAEIKARLAVGSWGDEKRSWAQLYLDEGVKTPKSCAIRDVRGSESRKNKIDHCARCRGGFRCPLHASHTVQGLSVRARCSLEGSSRIPAAVLATWRTALS